MEQPINQAPMASTGMFLTVLVSGTLFFSGNVLNNKNIENNFNYWIPNASKTSNFSDFKSIVNSNAEKNKENQLDYSMTVISAESREVIYMNDDNHLTQRDYDALKDLIKSSNKALTAEVDKNTEKVARKLDEKIAKLPNKEDVRIAVKLGINDWAKDRKQRNFDIWKSIVIPLIAAIIGALFTKYL